MKVDIFNTGKKYEVIYADPPWEYRESGGVTNSHGMAKQHYHTMPTYQICNLPVRRLAYSNSVLLMWATFPNIDSALKVMDAWGFKYKTAAFVWVKMNKKNNEPLWGMGSYTRANAEICLLGIGENTKAKQMVKSRNVHSVIMSPIEEHSKKPDEARKRIERLFGNVDKIELFARQEVDGWDCWGNEV